MAVRGAGAAGQRRGRGSAQHPVGRGLRPAVIAHLVDEHQGNGPRLPRRGPQAALQVRDLGQVVRVGAVLLEASHAQPQSAALQHPPDPAQTVGGHGGDRDADGAQRPATGRRATRRRSRLLACGLAWWLMQPLHEGLLLRGVEDASGDSRPAHARAGPPAHRLGSGPASRTPYRAAAVQESLAGDRIPGGALGDLQQRGAPLPHIRTRVMVPVGLQLLLLLQLNATIRREAILPTSCSVCVPGFTSSLPVLLVKLHQGSTGVLFVRWRRCFRGRRDVMLARRRGRLSSGRYVRMGNQVRCLGHILEVE